MKIKNTIYAGAICLATLASQSFAQKNSNIKNLEETSKELAVEIYDSDCGCEEKRKSYFSGIGFFRDKSSKDSLKEMKEWQKHFDSLEAYNKTVRAHNKSARAADSVLYEKAKVLLSEPIKFNSKITLADLAGMPEQYRIGWENDLNPRLRQEVLSELGDIDSNGARKTQFKQEEWGSPFFGLEKRVKLPVIGQRGIWLDPCRPVIRNPCPCDPQIKADIQYRGL